MILVDDDLKKRFAGFNMATCQGRAEGYAPMTMAESTKVGKKNLCKMKGRREVSNTNIDLKYSKINYLWVSLLKNKASKKGEVCI